MRAAFLIACAVITSFVLAQRPTVSDNGVLNAASFAPGQVVTRGSLVSIFGSELASGLAQASSIPLSTSLGDVSVTFDGIPAPILFVSPGQINAQLPWAGSSSGAGTVVVRRGNQSSEPKQFQIGPVGPGIFSLNFGVGTAIAINLDGTIAAPENSIPGLLTRPVRIGEPLILFGTGFGQVDPPAVTGNNSVDALRRNVMTPTVLIGGREATVQFSGLAPDFVGVNQLNIVVPNGVTPGNAVPIQVRMGDITTTDQVIIAVAAN